MDGWTKTSIPDVITRDLLSLCLRSIMAMSLVATPRLSGNLLIILVSMLMIVMRCCSTCLANVTSPTNEQEKRYGATHHVDLIMLEGS
jgi:hypothetical protein